MAPLSGTVHQCTWTWWVSRFSDDSTDVSQTSSCTIYY
jgi:hypothetical protein